MPRPVHAALQLSVLPLPWRIRRLVLTLLLGWRVHPLARIGWSYVAADRVVMEAGARIGHFTVIRGLANLELGRNGAVGNWNWITAATSLPRREPADGTLRIGPEAAITHRHYVDCTGGVSVGELATVAGVRSTLLTHQIDVETARQSTAPIRIGARALVSSNVSITPGGRVPARCLVAMGSVVLPGLSEEGMLYAGVPARAVRAHDPGARYFSREQGRVPPPDGAA